MKTKLLVYSILIALALTSCSSTNKITGENRAYIKETVKNPATALVDVRIPEQFNEATAKNAVNIPLAEIENHLDFFKKQRQIVVFCNSGRQAGEAINKLKKHGITVVHNGISWKNVKAIQEEK